MERQIRSRGLDVQSGRGRTKTFRPRRRPMSRSPGSHSLVWWWRPWGRSSRPWST